MVYTLRAQGLSSYEIRQALPNHFPQLAAPDDLPDPRTIQRWLSDPDATAHVSQDAARLRATYTAAAMDVVPTLFAGINAALGSDETGKVRDLAQALSAVTRGIVRDQLEITPGKMIDTPDELAAILARNGVLLTSEHKNVLSDAQANTVDKPRASETDAARGDTDAAR